MKNQRGFTLIEMVLAIAIMGSMMSGLAWTTNQYVGSVKRDSTSQYMIKWVRAADQYIKDNSATLALTATPTVPAMVTTAQLIGANLLDAGTSVTNPYGQTVCAKVLQPSANVLTALVVTNGGTAVSDIDGGEIASRMGANGGFIKTGTPTTAQGAYGGWSVSTVNYKDCVGAVTVAGNITGALFFNNTVVLGDYLYRNAVAGHPEANTMGTTLNMGNQNIAAAGTYAGTSSTLSGLATMAGGASITSGNLQMNGLNVAGVGTLTATNGNIATVNATTLNGTTGNIRTVNSTTGNIATVNATTLNGTTGNIGTVNSTTGNIATVNATTLNGTTGNIGTVNATNVNASNQVKMAQGYMTGGATLGGACSPNGILRQDGTGLLLSCQAAVWAQATGAGGGGGGSATIVSVISGNTSHGGAGPYACNSAWFTVPAGVNNVVFAAVGGRGGDGQKVFIGGKLFSSSGGGGGGAAGVFDNTFGWLLYIGGGGGGGSNLVLSGFPPGNGGNGGSFNTLAFGGSGNGFNSSGGGTVTTWNTGGGGGGGGPVPWAGGAGGAPGSGGQGSYIYGYSGGGAGGFVAGGGAGGGVPNGGGGSSTQQAGGGGGGWGGGGGGGRLGGGGGAGSSYMSTRLTGVSGYVALTGVAGHRILLFGGCGQRGGQNGIVSISW